MASEGLVEVKVNLPVAWSQRQMKGVGNGAPPPSGNSSAVEREHKKRTTRPACQDGSRWRFWERKKNEVKRKRGSDVLSR